MTSRLFSFVCAGFLLFALLVGGASRGEVVAPDLVVLASVPLLGWGIWRLRKARPEGLERWGFLLLAGCFLLGLFQLIPLPPGLWSALPGHSRISADLAAAGIDRGWAPISLTPTQTAAALLNLLPAAAVFLASRTLDAQGRRWSVLVLMLVAVASAVVGLLQVLGGPTSPLRFYEVTNPEPAVGFFANRNHLASLFAVVIPFAIAEALGALRRGRSAPSPLRSLLMAALVVLCIAGVALTQSRAGVILVGLGVLGGFAMAIRSGLAKGREKLALAGLGLAALAGVLAAPLVFGGAFDRMETGLTGELRLLAAGATAKAIVDYLPFGSGLGSFVPVYMMYEHPAVMQNTYLNHAHNDWLELLLEGGLLAAGLMLGFLAWLAFAARAAWRAEGSSGPIARAAGLAIALLLVHSLADYPLRTPAMLCVFALACGLLLSPRERQKPAKE